MAEGTEQISLAEAEALIAAALRANGVPEGAALSVASALVAAEAEGQVGHGFSRLEDYIAQARSGKIVAGAEISVSQPAAARLVVDAGHGFAYPALDIAAGRGVALAQETGLAGVSVIRSHHCGALSVQVARIAQAGMIGLMVANTPAAIAPWGGHRPVFGTNPIAFGVPRAGQAPLVIDLSLSRVARGKVMHARKAGQPIPEGWALDASGAPTTDPEAALAGSMVPIGEAKGSALALMVEILASTLAGAVPSFEAGSFFSPEGAPPGVGQFLLVLRPADGAGFAARLEHLLGEIAAQEGVRLPGTRGAAARARAAAEGLFVPAAYLESARRLARG